MSANCKMCPYSKHHKVDLLDKGSCDKLVEMVQGEESFNRCFNEEKMYCYPYHALRKNERGESKMLPSPEDLNQDPKHQYESLDEFKSFINSNELIKDFKAGDRVTYFADYSEPVRGIVKAAQGDVVFVVFYCGDDWKGTRTIRQRLRPLRT